MYVLPYGQMSLWGATVITSLMSAIPWVGQDIVEFIWGGFSVNNATLNRFFALHFVLPFILAALALMHLIALHDSAGSGNPLGVSGNYDRLPFAPYYIFKDLITIFIFILILSMFVFFMPNLLGDSENYVMANPMQTPPAIVPEWYLLPFYAILRSIPNKLLGVIAMFSAILILLVMPFTDLSRSRGTQFKPLSKAMFFIFVGNFLILMELGAKHVESPFIEFGQFSTVLYFAHFLVIVPFISLLENSLTELASIKDKIASKKDEIEIDYSKLYMVHSGLFGGTPCPICKKSWVANPNSLNYSYWNSAPCLCTLNDGSGDKICPICKQKVKNCICDPPRYTAIRKAGGYTVYREHAQPLNTPNSKIISLALITTAILFATLVFTLRVWPLNISILTEADKIPFDISVLTAPMQCDAPRPWGIYFQDSATPQMEALVEMHDNILFYLVIILFGVGWLLISIAKNYTDTKAPISLKYSSHGTMIELIWTITPALILILIAFPSFKLLYLMDEVTDPAMAVLAEGHQWYWSYQYPDFLNSDDEFIEFDSYLVPESDLEDGALRMLEVDNRLIIPELTHIRFIVTGADVIHSLACPAIGIKCDAYPGRLNQVSVMVNRAGVFYGVRP